jgi:hypothetical protein
MHHLNQDWGEIDDFVNYFITFCKQNHAQITYTFIYNDNLIL